MSSTPHSFGGSWTEIKLQVLTDYMKAYLIALKKQPFKTVYIDAFAGTGEREQNRAPGGDTTDTMLFGDETDVALFEQSRSVFQGSAARALALDFDEYIFIERNAAYAQQLEELRARHHAPERIHIINGLIGSLEPTTGTRQLTNNILLPRALFLEGPPLS